MSLIATTTPTREDRTSRARTVWGWIGIVALIAVIGAVASAFEHNWNAPSPLDHDSPRYDGALAVTTYLEERGVTVDAADRLGDARELLAGSETLVITDASILHPDDLAQLTAAAADTVVLGGDYAALDALFPGIEFGGFGDSAPVEARCDLPAATNAGAIVPGETYIAPGIDGCYPVGDGDALLRADVDADSVVTLVDGSSVFVNSALDVEGHAALAAGLLGQHDRLVWYTPSPSDAAADGNPTLGDFVPPWVTPVIVLAIIGTIAAAIWRGRRFGPLVAETLPVTVRARETLEGRARLYRAAADSSHALDAIRRGALARMARRTGLAPDRPADEVARAVAGALGRDPGQVFDILARRPHNDDEFADLGARLRELENSLDQINPWEGRSR